MTMTMRSLLLIKLSLALIYVSIANCQFIKKCDEELMRVRRENFIWNDASDRIINYNLTHYNIYSYSFSKKWSPEIKFETSIENRFPKKIFYGFTLYENVLLEAISEKISIITVDDLTNYTFTRYVIPIEACRLRAKHETGNFNRSNPVHNISSLLFALCEWQYWAENDMFVLRRNAEKLQILKISNHESKYDLLTLSPGDGDLKYFTYDWKMYQKNANIRTETHLSEIYLAHSKNYLYVGTAPDVVNEFFRGVLYFVFHTKDSENYLFAIRSDITLVYNAGTKLFETLAKSFEEGVSQKFVPPKLVTKFPNNFWYDCPVPLCEYSDLDFVLNVESNDKTLSLKLIKNGHYFNIKENNSTGELIKLNIDSSETLRHLLSGLIVNRRNIDKDILNEFLNLRNLDDGNHLILDAKRDVYFFVKESRVYFLVNTRSGGSINQIIAKQDLKSFFGKKVSNSLAQQDSFIQSTFTRPKNRLVLLMNNFLIQYSYANWDKANLAEIDEDLAIFTLNQISASFTFRNSTYVLSKYHYQLFSKNRYTEQPVRKIRNDLLHCDAAYQFTDKQPDLIVYSAIKPEKIDSSFTIRNIAPKLILQLIGLISFLTTLLVIVSLVYVKKYHHKSANSFRKYNNDKNSTSAGSTGNLSTLFNLAKSSSDKPTRDLSSSKTVSKLILPEPKLSPSKLDSLAKNKPEKSVQSKYIPVTPSQTFDDLGNTKKLLIRKSSARSKVTSFIKVESGRESKMQTGGVTQLNSKMKPTSSNTPSKLAIKSKVNSKLQTQSPKSKLTTTQTASKLNATRSKVIKD